MRNLRYKFCLMLSVLIALIFSSTLVLAETVFTEGFESGWGNWYADNGVWEVGTPTTGPTSSHSGTQCVATILGGNYPAYTNSRLISPSIILPPIYGQEEIHLRFFQWFSFAPGGNVVTIGSVDYHPPSYGYVQISTYDSLNGEWSAWTNISAGQEGSSPAQSVLDIDLTAYANKKIKIGFYLQTDYFTNLGWYIDDITIEKEYPVFSGDFESGWGNWYADNGVWEVGTPAAGPTSSHSGTQCVATVLGGKYSAYTNSRLISPSIFLSPISANEEIHLRFFQWFSFASGGNVVTIGSVDYHPPSYGYVQISTFDSSSGNWSSWTDINGPLQGTSTVWSPLDIDLTAYANKKVRIGFYLQTDYFTGLGWYIDDISITGVSLPTACAATINENYSLNIPFLSYNNSAIILSADFVYDPDPSYSTLIPFKLKNAGILNKPSYSCTPSSISSDLSVHIPELILPDGITHLWVDLMFNQALSTDGNYYWTVSNAGFISN